MARPVVEGSRAVLGQFLALAHDLFLSFTPDDLPSYISLLRAIKCGLVEVRGDRNLLDTFNRVFSRADAA